MKKNRITICGRKTSTLPTPPISPSLRKLLSRSGSGAASTRSPSQWKAASIASMPGVAQANTAWNMTNRMASRIDAARPRDAAARHRPAPCRHRARRSGAPRHASSRSASRWPPRNSPASGALHDEAPAAGRLGQRAVDFGAAASSVPPRRTATELTTGTPSSRARRSASISMPRLRAMSIMLSDSITGRPTRFSSSARRSASRRLEASATQTIRSGATSLARRPEHGVARDLLVGRARAQ